MCNAQLNKNLISNILREHYTDGFYITHTSMIEPTGKFQFSRQTLEEFFNLYCQEIENKNYFYGITEKPQQYVPILIDIDLKIKTSSSSSLYSEKQVLQIINIYNRVLKETIEIENSDLTCVFLSKPSYIQKDNLKHGFHLHYPKIFMDQLEIENHLVPKVKELVKESKIFDYLDIEDSSSTIDDKGVKNTWLCYGSKKEENATPYLLDKIYNHELQQITLHEAFENYQIYDNHGRVININGRYNFYLPRILSIIPYSRDVKEIKDGLIPIQVLKSIALSSSKKNEFPEDKKMTSSEKLKIAKLFLPLLSKERADNYTEWMSVGWTLFNISEGCEEGLKLWLNFSSKCDEKYNEKECISKWEKMKPNEYTIGTIKLYASVDSPEEYRKIKLSLNSDGKQTDKIKLLLDNFSNAEVARFFYENKKDKYANVDGQWFELNNFNIWVPTSGKAYNLNKQLIDYITDTLRNYRTKMTQEMVDEEDKLKEKLKDIAKAIKTISSSTFQKHTIEQLEILYQDTHFMKKLNTNRMLFAFEDKVLDLKNNEVRDIKPEDYISFHCGYKYPLKIESDIIEAKKHLQTMFQSEDELNFALLLFATCLRGENYFQKFFTFIGSGGNGKGIFCDAFSRVFGKYWSEIPMTYWYSTSSRDSSKPDPIGFGLVNKRVIYSTEAVSVGEQTKNEPVKLAISKLKNWTGGDMQQKRDCHGKSSEMIEFIPYGTVLLNTNVMPKISEKDKKSDSFIRRLIMVHFKMSFKSTQELEMLEENPFVKLANPEIKEILNSERMRNALLHIIIDIYSKNVRNAKEIKLPGEVQKTTSSYIYKNQKYIERFMRLNYKISQKERINRTEVYDKFTNAPLIIETIQIKDGKRKISSSEFYTILNDLGYKMLTNKTGNRQYSICLLDETEKELVLNTLLQEINEEENEEENDDDDMVGNIL